MITTHGRLDIRRLRQIGFAAMALSGFIVIAFAAGIRINTSSSLPLGIYVVTTDPAAKLIEFCPIEPFASQSSERGYRTRGTACHDGAVPLLKPIVAVEGDSVTVSEDGISVNGHLLPKTAPLIADRARRQLQPWPIGEYRVETGQVWVASTYSFASYDSRYMGPVQTSQIRGRLRPLWLLQ